MADTLSLDTAVQFIIDRGGSVRLVGDDQQLAAIPGWIGWQRPAATMSHRCSSILRQWHLCTFSALPPQVVRSCG